MASKVQPPYYPIIYVRGYVGTESAIEETVADAAVDGDRGHGS